MPKKQARESVLYDWVHDLTFQMQALLMTGIRGADGSGKHNSAKCISRYLRGVVLKPAGNWSGKNDNDFMWGDYDYFNEYRNQFFNDHDEYPHHFIMHLVHCAEVVGYKHPDDKIREKWYLFYLKACSSFHMTHETHYEMNERLNDFGCGYEEEHFIPAGGTPERSLPKTKEYNIIPMSNITDEARKIAVAWVEGYKPAGMINLDQKHKLASDIMNYADHFMMEAMMKKNEVLKQVANQCLGREWTPEDGQIITIGVMASKPHVELIAYNGEVVGGIIERRGDCKWTWTFDPTIKTFNDAP
jgi:hypothetical protein